MKQLPDGRISLNIQDIGNLLNEAIVARMIDEDQDGVMWALLEEIRCKLIQNDGKRIKLRQSEFRCLLQPETLGNLDEHEQMYLLAVLMPKKLNHRKRKRRSTVFIGSTEAI